jgi:hypothetical protein
MIWRLVTVLGTLLCSASLMAQEFTYHEVREWHFDRVKNVLKVNSLEKKMDFALDIYRVSEDKKVQEKEQVKLPGLLLNKPDEISDKPKTLFSENDVIHFKRMLTLINLNEVPADVVEKVKNELSESLYFSDKDNISVVNSSIAVSEIQKTDAFSRIYDTMAQKSLIMWIMVLSCLTMFTLWELKKILLESANKISESINEMKAQNNASDQEEDKFDDKDDEASQIMDTKIDLDYKPEISILVANFYTSIQKHPGHLLATIYKVFNDQESIIKLFSYLDQSEVTEDRRKMKELVLDFMKEHILFVDGMSIVSTDIDIVPRVKYFFDVLTAMKFLRMNPNAEKLYLAVLLKTKYKYKQLVESLADKYFNIIYFLFPDELKSIMRKDKELLKSFSLKIVDLVASGQSINNVNDIEIKKFMDDVLGFDVSSGNTAVGADGSFARMLYYLSDTELTALESDSNRELIHSVPKLTWLRGSDRNILKDFIVSLAPAELKLFSENVNNFSKIIQNFDARTAFRLNETLATPIEISENTWYDLRFKISKYYAAPESENADVSNQAQGSQPNNNDLPPIPKEAGDNDETKKAG